MTGDLRGTKCTPDILKVTGRAQTGSLAVATGVDMQLHQRAGNLVLLAFVAGYAAARVAFGEEGGVWLDVAIPFVGIALAFLTAHLLRPAAGRER